MDCIFCKIIAGEIPVKILKETSSSISFLDAFPLARGHVLVIPKNHHKKIQDMTTDENSDLFSLVHTMMSKIDSITGSTLLAIHNGENAGQEIPHVHVHLIPINKMDDMSLDTKVKLTENEFIEIMLKHQKKKIFFKNNKLSSEKFL